MPSPFTRCAAIAAFSLCVGAASSLAADLSVSASRSTAPLLNMLGQAYHAESNTSLRVTQAVNQDPVQACLNGQASFAFINRELTDNEKQSGLVATPVAFHAVAVAVNSSNTTGNISLNDLAAIFNGSSPRWSNGSPAVPFFPTDSSLLRDCFSTTVLAGKSPAASVTSCDHATALAGIMNNPNAITFCSAAEAPKGFKFLKVNGVEPTLQNIRSGAYPIALPINLVTKGAPSAEVKAFAGFASGQSGRSMITAMGALPAGAWSTTASVSND